MKPAQHSRSTAARTLPEHAGGSAKDGKTARSWRRVTAATAVALVLAVVGPSTSPAHAFSHTTSGAPGTYWVPPTNGTFESIWIPGVGFSTNSRLEQDASWVQRAPYAGAQKVTIDNYVFWHNPRDNSWYPVGPRLDRQTVAIGPGEQMVTTPRWGRAYMDFGWFTVHTIVTWLTYDGSRMLGQTTVNRIHAGDYACRANHPSHICQVGPGMVWLNWSR